MNRKGAAVSTNGMKRISKAFKNIAEGPLSFSTLESRQNSSATSADAGADDDDERAGNVGIAWFVDY